MADDIAEAARLYEQYQKANKMTMDTEKYGSIAPADTSLRGAINDSIHRFSNPGMEAGLESTVFTEPIANWLESPSKREDWGALTPAVNAVGKTAAGFVPKTRGDALLATALASIPVMKHFKSYPGAIGVAVPQMRHPPLYQRIRKLGGESPAKMSPADMGPTKALPARAARRIAVRDRLTTGQKLARDAKTMAGEVINDSTTIARDSGLSLGKVKGAITNAMPSAANDIAAWARRYFAGEE